jgi:Leucine-rich repeat (LRR) protein
MAGLGGLFTSIISMGKKVLPAIQAATATTSSSSASQPEVTATEADLKELMRLLERIRATLLDAEEREVKDRAVKHWLEELRGVAFDAEDVLEEYKYEIHRVEVQTRGAFFMTSSRKRKQIEASGVANDSVSVPLSEGMVERIRNIRHRFDEIARDHESLRLHEEDGARQPEYLKYPLPTTPLVNTARVFGRQEEKDDVVRMVTDDIRKKSLSVATIIGTGGLGKTTLAQLVYNDSRICNEFDLFGWVCASEDFDVKRLTKSMLESITRRGTILTELSALQENLRDEVRDKRVFVVLDDVWNVYRSHWDLLQLPFMSAKSVIFLVTTRSDMVAKLMQTMLPYRLDKLPEEDSWQLFQYYAFSVGNHLINSNLLKIGRQIMQKCGGLPLAIKSLASLVSLEYDEEGWIEILESDLWEPGPTDEIYAPLQISYQRLPAYLKPCFLFCSTFPKDSCFSTDQLVSLWISQGYVISKGDKMLEEVASDYVYDLRRRSFFDDAGETVYRSFYSTNIESTFKLHDMIHNLAQTISGKEHFSMENVNISDFPNKVYHLYATSQMGLVKPLASGNLKCLHTLILHLNNEEESGFLYADPDFPSFDGGDISRAKRLRALEIRGHGCRLELTGSIGNLKHLRHLSLHCFKFETLPEAICSLYNLQRLNIEECDKLKELPRDIGNLIGLQFLSLQTTAIKKLPESFYFLTKLKILRIMACPLDEIGEEIGNLAQLRELILHEIEIKTVPESICQIKELQKLGITYCCNVMVLPRDLGELTNLKSVQFCYTMIEFLPASLAKMATIHTLYVVLEYSKSIGWLKDFVNLKEILCIEGLENINGIEDAQLADLRSKPYIRELFLSWTPCTQDFIVGISLLQVCIQENDMDMLLGKDTDILVLEALQPHSNLQEITIDGYRGSTFPKWLEDPALCVSLDKIWVENCRYLGFLPFCNLVSIRHLSLDNCHNLHVLTEESLPSQLNSLSIKNCGMLGSVTGLKKLTALAELKLWNCSSLEALVIHGLVLQTLVCLKDLKIYKCPKLQFVMEDSVPSASCNVKISGCPLLRIWCLEHDVEYQRCILVAFCNYFFISEEVFSIYFQLAALSIR